METNFTPLRIVSFIVLVAAFVAICLYLFPVALHLPVGARQAVCRGRGAISLLFVMSAYTGCFTDFQYGFFPPKSLRPLIVVGSAALMILAVFLMWSLQRGLVLNAAPNV